MEQVEGELLVVGDVELLDVDLREDVERRLRFHGGDAGDLIQGLVHKLALVIYAPARHDVAVHALVPAEGRLHDGLRRHVRAEAHVREHVQALDQVAGAALVPREHHPPDAVSGDHMALRQAGERDAEQIGGEARNGDVLKAVHDQAVVDLIREDHELMLAGDLDDLLQDLARVEGAGWVVGVDDDDGLGAWGDLLPDVIEVGVPLGLLVAEVVHGRAAGEGRARGPEWIVGTGDQDLVAVVEDGLHAEVDELGHAVAGVDALEVDVRQMLELGVLHDRLARREETTRIGVPLALGELLAHVLDDLIGRAEAEGGGVADVQLEHAHALGLHAGRLIDHGTADIVEDVVEFG